MYLVGSNGTIIVHRCRSGHLNERRRRLSGKVQAYMRQCWHDPPEMVSLGEGVGRLSQSVVVVVIVKPCDAVPGWELSSHNV